MMLHRRSYRGRISSPDVVCWAASLGLIGCVARLHVKTLHGQATVGAEPEAEHS